MQSQECLLDEEDMPSGSSSEAESGKDDGEALTEEDEPTPDPTCLRAAAEQEEEQAVRNSSPHEISFEVLCYLQL